MTEVPGELRDTPRSRGRRDSSRISPVVRITGLVLGFALAIAATLAVFLTDNAVYLRLAVIAVAWAFVIAAFSAGRRKTDQAVAEGRESELRQAYALELEREVAARREYELKLENQLRRETQEAMRAELDKLRADLASLAGLRDQLTGLGELQADMGRLRAELTEQLSGEMLVERIVMRTQSIRMPAERPELAAPPLAIDGTLHDWTDEPVRLGDVRPRVVPPPPVAPAVDRTPVVDRAPVVDRGPEPAEVPSRPVEPTSPTEPARPDVPASRHVSPTQEDRVARSEAAARHTAEQPRVVLPPVAAATEPVAAAAEPVAEAPAPPAPARPLPDPEPAAAGPSTALWETPAGDDERPHRRRAPEEPPPPPAAPLHEPDVFETAGHQRLTEILAESGATLGGRRRRRYRDDDGNEDDVLARVLDNR